MTPEQINVAIAEVCGWKNDGMGWWFTEENPVLSMSRKPPACFSDLNACAEMEATLEDAGCSSNPKGYETAQYAHALGKIVGVNLRKIVTNHNMSTNIYASPYESIKLIRAPAPQRCEAFLRVKGLWIE